MTGRARPAPGMVLPLVDADGRVTAPFGGWLRDIRVPRRLSLDGDRAALVGAGRRPQQCPEGRHLFDALLCREYAAVPAQLTGVADAGGCRFRLSLTCTRCGIVERLTGRLAVDEPRQSSQQVDPHPLRAGRLRAQEQARERLDGSIVLSTWGVYDDTGALVGRMGSDITRRGRRHVAGRLDAWPPAQHIQATTAPACLRRLAAGDTAKPAAMATEPAGQCGVMAGGVP